MSTSSSHKYADYNAASGLIDAIEEYAQPATSERGSFADIRAHLIDAFEQALGWKATFVEGIPYRLGDESAIRWTPNYWRLSSEGDTS